MIGPIRIRWAGLDVMGSGEIHRRFWWGNLMERGNLEDLGVDRKVISK